MCSQSHNQGIMTKSQPKKVNRLQFIIKMNEFYLPFFENFLSSISNDKYHIIAETHARTQTHSIMTTMAKTTENIIIEFRFWKITLDGCSTAITTTAVTTTTKLNVFRVSYVLRINLRHLFLFSRRPLFIEHFNHSWVLLVVVRMCAIHFIDITISRKTSHLLNEIVNFSTSRLTTQTEPSEWWRQRGKEEKKCSKKYRHIYVTKLVWMMNFIIRPNYIIVCIATTSSKSIFGPHAHTTSQSQQQTQKEIIISLFRSENAVMQIIFFDKFRSRFTSLFCAAMIYWFAGAISFLLVAYFSFIGIGMPCKVLRIYRSKNTKNVFYGILNAMLHAKIIVNNFDCCSNK